MSSPASLALAWLCCVSTVLVTAMRTKASYGENHSHVSNATAVSKDCDAALADGACCVWFSSCSCCSSGDSEEALFECWSARKCAKKPKQTPIEALTGGSPWSSKHPLCYAQPLYLDHNYCQKGGYKADLTDVTDARKSKSVASPTISALGYQVLNTTQKYTVVIDKAKLTGDRMFGVLTGATANVAALGAGLLVANGGMMLGWVSSTVNVLFGESKDHTLDLQPNFDRFEKYLDRKAFQQALNSIRAKYAVFLRWFKELETVGEGLVSQTALHRSERHVDTIEMQLDLAEQEFRHGLPVDEGLASYYLFEPLFSHAFLHTSVILLHATYLCSIGDLSAAKRKLVHAKRKHDAYRTQLSEMVERALEWRVSLITAHGKSLSAASLCQATHTRPVSAYPKDSWEIEYSWADTFFPESIHSEKMVLRKLTMTSSSGKTFCDISGEATDGRAMFAEAQTYRSDLNASLKQHFGKLLQAFDSVWAEMPPCVPGFEFRLIGDNEVCTATLSATEINEHFGTLGDDANSFWPEQAPVVDPLQYVSCELSNGPQQSGNALLEGGLRLATVRRGLTCVRLDENA